MSEWLLDRFEPSLLAFAVLFAVLWCYFTARTMAIFAVVVLALICVWRLA